jgi:hypothetical protein
MTLNSSSLSSTADQLERLSKLIRLHPDKVLKALADLDGNDGPDVIYLPSETRIAVVGEIANSLAISREDLRILDYIVMKASNVC